MTNRGGLIFRVFYVNNYIYSRFHPVLLLRSVFLSLHILHTLPHNTQRDLRVRRTQNITTKNTPLFAIIYLKLKRSRLANNFMESLIWRQSRVIKPISFVPKIGLRVSVFLKNQICQKQLAIEPHMASR